MLDLQGEVEALWGEIESAVHRVLRSGRFILGPEVEAFEREAAAYLGAKYAVGLNSGTDALVIGLRALGIGPGDEVITTAFSFFATAEAILHVGATPVFIDIRSDDFNLDPDRLEGALTERTRAILPVHLYGNPAAMGSILEVAERHAIRVLEDCAQSFGARYGGAHDKVAPPAQPPAGRMTGTLGDLGAFSFYPTKSLGAYGDGGMLVTDDDDLALSARKLRNHGGLTRYRNEMLGYNSRLDELQAAVLRVKLPYVDRWRDQRRANAERYHALLDGCPGLTLPRVSAEHIVHQYTVRVPATARDAAIAALKAAGVDSAVYYPTPLDALVPGVNAGPLPCALAASQTVLSLPVWAGLASDRIDRVAATLRASLSC
jgi:dTDP-4-amino-4,6-dideoxygalactose transaminase